MEKIRSVITFELSKKRYRSFTKFLTIYSLLLIFGFVFISPILFVILRSFMPTDDFFNPLVVNIPSTFTLDNFRLILERTSYLNTLLFTTYLSGVSAAFQVLSCGLMGYGLSRYNFKLKKVFLILVGACFVIPAQVLMIPTYLQYSNYGMLGSASTFFLPAALGQGLRSPIFILIFYSFFNTIPRALDEAAQIDGCSPLKVFFKIVLPLSLPAVVLTFIFSIVWYWNETYLVQLYLGSGSRTVISQINLALSFINEEAMRNPMAAVVNVPVRMAAILLIILPLIVFYLIMQRHFVESIERSGITGE